MTRNLPTENTCEIRRLAAADLDILNEAFRLEGYFETLLNDQQAGRAVVFIGWMAERPVAHGYLWLAEEPETLQHITAHPLVRKLLPETPFIQSLQVVPEAQGQRIGTRLIAALEEAAIEHGHYIIALGVEPGDSPARRLYLELGYRNWMEGTIENTYQGVDDSGLYQTFTETSIIMTKHFPALERVSVGEFLVAGDGCGEGEECGEQVSVAFIADGEAAVAAEPGDGAFDGPAVASEACGGFDADAGDAVADAPLAQCPVAVGDVVGLVGVNLRGFASVWPAPGPDLGDALQQRLERLGVVEVGRRYRQGRR